MNTGFSCSLLAKYTVLYLISSKCWRLLTREDSGVFASGVSASCSHTLSQLDQIRLD